MTIVKCIFSQHFLVSRCLSLIFSTHEETAAEVEEEDEEPTPINGVYAMSRSPSQPTQSLSSSTSPVTHSPSQSASSSMPSIRKGKRQRKPTEIAESGQKPKGAPDTIDLAIVEALKQIQPQRAQPEPESDEEDLFGRQVAATLRRLGGQAKAFAKVQIQETLMEAEFGPTQDHQLDDSSIQYLH